MTDEPRSADDSPPSRSVDAHAARTGSEARFETVAVHAGQEPDELTGAVAPPIYQVATFAQDAVARPRRGYEYARSQNPTRERLERAVARLEGATHGIAFASGSACTAAIAELMVPGDEVVVGDDVYGGTFRFFERVGRPRGLVARYADLSGDLRTTLRGALTERTRLIWFETPTNPHLKVIDIERVAEFADGHRGSGGRRPDVVVDNTFASPAIQRPIEHGADIVFHSATKYLGGHSDVILGIAVTSNAMIAERLRFLQNALGSVPGPQDCFLVLRGLRTLALRVERQSANALVVARFLAGRDDIADLRYPGLADGPRAHPASAVVSRQMAAGGGMVSFVAAEGGRHGRTAAERAIAVCEATAIFTLAESLGGVESLIEVPASMTHASVAASPLECEPGLVRLSCGIEHADDLVADLAQALDRA